MTEKLILTRKQITDTYTTLCSGLDRHLGLDTYGPLYDGRYETLSKELDIALARFRREVEAIQDLKRFIKRLK